MTSPIIFLSLTTLLTSCATVVFTGPSVVPHPASNNIVRVLNNEFEVVREFNDPISIKAVQTAFLRAKKIGDTNSHLKATTHKIDFSDRWLIDLKSGEIGVLSKKTVNVYRLEPEDLKILQRLIPAKS